MLSADVFIASPILSADSFIASPTLSAEAFMLPPNVTADAFMPLLTLSAAITILGPMLPAPCARAKKARTSAVTARAVMGSMRQPPAESPALDLTLLVVFPPPSPSPFDEGGSGAEAGVDAACVRERRFATLRGAWTKTLTLRGWTDGFTVARSMLKVGIVEWNQIS
eukprot:CAMPEP_0202910440 /NCGR_PEP_ID=MMETSP1392-20130828/52081_1 /ASSEMBLY_ACC=CAM_ASM_000868 /TAXON_ID=225041 /ORGANISM="Chlamydomonas chlamydogama, Strain SAG 11-48b" /LENGTH=166 /DNA_ID=CAMNT_0049600561 /DNA_START=601 /DNA_END=1101 /DNA_ORIENTATION=-